MATLLDYRRASIPMPIGQPPRCNARRHIVLTKSPITMPGNTSSSTDGDVNIDKTAPVITFVGQSPAKNANGWNNVDVTLSWTCTDGTGSGVVSGTVSKTITTEGSGQTETGTCTDLAGNMAAHPVGDHEQERLAAVGVGDAVLIDFARALARFLEDRETHGAATARRRSPRITAASGCQGR